MGGKVDWTRLTPGELAGLLEGASRAGVTEAMVRADVAAGAPANPDGTLNLVRYAAWLAREEGRK